MILKRIFAWIIDWNICGLPAVVYSFVWQQMLQTEADIKLWHVLLFFLFFVSYPALFVFRDILLGGRSIGKRIFRLYIVDNRTNELPKRKKLIIRNLFFSIAPAEFIVLLITGRSLGDWITNTSVI